ncbi:cell division cycle 48C [Prunus dulcis]|uniref:Cell division cycle 48C n=1 Tax=Prunus dulcis TaxID=3755 RepID=A0A4Y1RL00_PRUDU|nr:cell division cycle 48C [Prunus dulcis]
MHKAVQEDPPSLKRQGFSAIPDVKWADVGDDALRHELDLHIVNRIKYPEIYEFWKAKRHQNTKIHCTSKQSSEFDSWRRSLSEMSSDNKSAKFPLRPFSNSTAIKSAICSNIKLETGFLLYGPLGCGKTLIAKAVANEVGANFIHIKGPELLNKKWGESEKAVRTLFSRARACTPCILFFDEVDALTTKRGQEGGRVLSCYILNQLLVELVGGDQRKGVIVTGAANSFHDHDDDDDDDYDDDYAFLHL